MPSRERESRHEYVIWLGADDLAAKGERLVVWVPSMTRSGQPIDHSYWRDETIRHMSALFGGATATSASGGWLDPDSHEIKMEEVTIVESYFHIDEWNQKNIVRLRKFLHRMGRETNQGEIGIHVKGEFLRIRRFDDE
jgi:hypothetical protein